MSFADVSGRPVGELLSLEGRGAVVTGAARGIGAATATRLAEAGATVMLADRDEEALDRARGDMAEAGRRVVPCVADVSDATSVAQLVAHARAQLPSLDAWVNSAVEYSFTRLFETSDDEWDRTVATNLRGVFICCREAGRVMAGAGRGDVIVNVTSTEAHRGMPCAVDYIASKHGVLGVTRAIAIELGRHGVRALCVAPTLIETDGMAETVRAMGPEGRQRWCDRLPAARIGVADDVARVILFAVSDMSSLMTGSVLMVDGGEMAGMNRMRLL